MGKKELSKNNDAIWKISNQSKKVNALKELIINV